MFKGLVSSLLLALMLFGQFYNSAVWIKYELNIEEITELFCINKDKPALMCNGKCYVKGELLDVDIFPENPQAPVAEVSYLPSLKLYVVNESVNVAIELSDFLKSNRATYAVVWESTFLDPPFIPPQEVS